MHKIFTFLTVLFFSFAFSPTTYDKNHSTMEILPGSVSDSSVEELSVEEEIFQLHSLFSEKNTSVPNLKSFKNGMLGYYKLAGQNVIKKEILTIIDFTLSSKEKRMWVLDMTNHKVLIHSVVSHGKNTGGEFATKFSNKVNSLQSSLGFYITGETYIGGNGLSLFIDGMEKEFNSKARERYVVIHGADYANPEFVNRIGMLGRSYGCPAVPTALTKKFINTIKGNSVLYIHSNDKTYLENSQMIKA